MANVLFSGTSLTLGTGSTDTYIVGDASDGVVGTILVHLDTTSAGTVSVVVKARPRSVP
jgi:hypothetical protein